MNQQRRQEMTIRQLLRGAALSGATPNNAELDELRRLRLPDAGVAQVAAYAAAVAAEGRRPNASLGALRKSADLLAHGVVAEHSGALSTNRAGPESNAMAAAVHSNRFGSVERDVVSGKEQGDDPGWRE